MQRLGWPAWLLLVGLVLLVVFIALGDGWIGFMLGIPLLLIGAVGFALTSRKR